MKAKPRSPMRKVCCPDCGYTIRMTRSWMLRGFPQCPCGSEMRPDSPADLAYCGIIGQEDCPRPLWTAICRENGWEDAILRTGAAAKSWTSRRAELKPRHADHCDYPGCGQWVKHGETYCPAHCEQDALAF